MIVVPHEHIDVHDRGATCRIEIIMKATIIVLYCICSPPNPESYHGARVLEASRRPLLVKGRSYRVEPIQEENAETGTKLAEEITE